MSMEDLKRQLTSDLLNLYTTITNEVRVDGRAYVPTRFLQKVTRSGGYETVVDLFSKMGPPHDGLTTLYEAERLDLSVEAFILKNSQYHSIFTQQMLNNARKQLKDLGFVVQ